MAFFILYESYVNIPLTDIHASGPAILILGYQIINALVFAKFPCEKSIKYSFMDENVTSNIPVILSLDSYKLEWSIASFLALPCFSSSVCVQCNPLPCIMLNTNQ